MLTRSYLAPDESRSFLAYTPMLHSRLFAETAKYRDQCFQPTRAGWSSPLEQSQCGPGPASEELYLDGNPSLDRPLIVQFCANNPDDLLAAAQHVQPFCDAVDLNLGCPQGIAKKGRYGAFLQEDWDLIYKLIHRLHTDLTVPVTAKIRILETKERTLAYARMVITAGASILTVHGRQRHQKSHNTGLADWDVIRYLRGNLPKDVVLFANGNILQREDIDSCRRITGADGVMSAEGNLCDPTIFARPPPIGAEGREYWRGRDGKGGYRMDAVMRRYLDIIYRYVFETDPPKRKPLFIASDETPRDAVQATEGQPKPKTTGQAEKKRLISPNLQAMQAHLFHLLRPLVSKHTHIRDALARCRTGDMDAFENVMNMVETVTMQGLLEYERARERDLAPPPQGSPVCTADTTSQTTSASSNKSSAAAVERCKRPWWICQPYVRPLPSEALEKGALTLGKKRSMLHPQGND